MTTATSTHALTFDTPNWRDYLNGGFGNLIAQCPCGAFEYVFSEREGAYWHSLHRSQPGRNPHHLMLGAPMPENWVEAPEPAEAAPAAHVPAQRGYTCRQCNGSGTVPAYGAHRGRFYQLGERTTCAECAGSGSVEEWAA